MRSTVRPVPANWTCPLEARHCSFSCQGVGGNLDVHALPILTRRIFKFAGASLQAPRRTAPPTTLNARAAGPRSALRSGMNRPRLRSARCRFSLRYSLRLRDGTELLGYSNKLKTTRKPKSKIRKPGLRMQRPAERQILAVPLQPPPRITRSEPNSGPVGSSSGEFA